MELWIIATLFAALFQTARFVLQKRLKQVGLSSAGATWVRFVWSVPMLAVALGLYLAVSGAALPGVLPGFWFYVLAGGVGQILATVCVVALFSLRNFAVGITLKKSEVLQTVLVGWLILGESVSAAGFGALMIGLVALLLLTSAPTGGKGLELFRNKATGLGLMSGAFFALAGVAYRGATLSLDGGDVGLRAAVALICVTVTQNFMMVAWFLWRDRGQIGKVLRAWRPGLAVGATSLAGSFCWFTAFALQNAAYVYALGQVELLFSMIGGAVFFGEKLSMREKLGIGLLMVSIVVLVLVT